MDRHTVEDPAEFDEAAEFQHAVDLARAADVAVVVVGEWQNMIGELASRSSLELPGRQLELLQAVVDTGTPVVLLVMNGRPLDLRWPAEHVPAILDIWYPGTRGGTAVANLLFGDVSPGGKLPFTWPRTVGQVPMVYSHTLSHEPENQARRYWDADGTPLFPFGFGLSYGRFEYANLTVDQPVITTTGTVTVAVEITNTSDRDADEIVQLYIHQRHGAASLSGTRAQGLPADHPCARGNPHHSAPDRAGRTALLERGCPRLGDRHRDLRRLGRWKLNGAAGDELRGHERSGQRRRALLTVSSFEALPTPAEPHAG